MAASRQSGNANAKLTRVTKIFFLNIFCNVATFSAYAFNIQFPLRFFIISARTRIFVENKMIGKKGPGKLLARTYISHGELTHGMPCKNFIGMMDELTQQH